MGQDGSTLEAILLMLRENCIFQKMVFRPGGSAILELQRAVMRPRCQHSSNMSPYSLNERCSQPKPGPLRETSTVAIQITIITIAVRPISWGHVGARWGHVGPMSSPIGRSFRPPPGGYRTQLVCSAKNAVSPRRERDFGAAILASCWGHIGLC